MTTNTINLFAKFKAESNWDPFDTYEVKLRVFKLVGGIPMDPQLLDAWLQSKFKIKNLESKADKEKTEKAEAALVDAVRSKSEAVKSHAELLEEAQKEIGEQMEKSAIGFHKVDGQLVIEGRQVKAMLKESGNIIKDIAPDGAVGALKSKVADKTFIEENFIPIGRTEPDEILERPIHVITAQGPRDSLKRCQVCNNVEIQFTVKRRIGPDKSGVPEKVLMGILDYAQRVGLGADRSQGCGKFEVLSVVQVAAGHVK